MTHLRMPWKTHPEGLRILQAMDAEIAAGTTCRDAAKHLAPTVPAPYHIKPDSLEAQYRDWKRAGRPGATMDGEVLRAPQVTLATLPALPPRTTGPRTLLLWRSPEGERFMAALDQLRTSYPSEKAMFVAVSKRVDVPTTTISTAYYVRRDKQRVRGINPIPGGMPSLLPVGGRMVQDGAARFMEIDPDGTMLIIVPSGRGKVRRFVGREVDIVTKGGA